MNDRTEEMILLHLFGSTLREIGEKYGISHQRVQQILSPHPFYKPILSHKSGRRVDRRINKIIRYQAWKLYHEGESVVEVAKTLGVPKPIVIRYLRYAGYEPRHKGSRRRPSLWGDYVRGYGL